MTHFETEISRALAGVEFPADQIDLVEQARANDASAGAIEAIESLNWHTFASAAVVMEAFEAGLVKYERPAH